jgi:hypothetical protein
MMQQHLKKMFSGLNKLTFEQMANHDGKQQLLEGNITRR